MIVVDAQIIIRAIRSAKGASHRILVGLLKGELPFALTPAIMFEYQDVLSRPDILGSPQLLTETEIDVILDALCAKCFATVWTHQHSNANGVRGPRNDDAIFRAFAR